MSGATKDWALGLIGFARVETKTFGAQLSPAERETPGEAQRWSTKDEWAHLAFWLETFADNLIARLEGRAPKDIRDYQALNSQTWLERRGWTWTQADAALYGALDRLEGQIATLELKQLTDAGMLTLEPPKPLIRTLLYEVVDHPTHHLVRLYAKTGRGASVPALLERTRAALAQRGMSAWTRSSRTRLDKHARWLEDAAG
jgi:hypothetical protein